MQVVSVDGASIEVPETWEVKDTDDGKSISPEYGGILVFQVADWDASNSPVDQVSAGFFAGLSESDAVTVSDAVERTRIGDAIVFRADTTYDTDDALLKGVAELILNENKMYSILFLVPDSSYDQHSGEISAILDSLKLESPTESASGGVQIVTYGGAGITVPSTWKVTDADNGKNVYPEYGGLIYLYSIDVTEPAASVDEAFAEYAEGLERSGQFTVSDNVEKTTIGKAIAFRTDVSYKNDSASLKGRLEIILTGDKLYSIIFAIPDGDFDWHSEEIDAILDTIELDSPTAPVISEKTDGDGASNTTNTSSQKPAQEPAPAPVPEPEASKYEYAYVRRLSNYDLYYLIDLDEMTATSFGTNDSSVMVLPCSGDLESGLTIDYVDDGFQEHLRFKTSGNDTVAILTDAFGSEWEYTKTDAAQAEAVLASVG